MGWLRRAKPEPFVLPELPDWSALIDRESGEILLDEAPPLDVSGLDVLGQDADQEAAVGRVEERASAFFGGALRPGLSGGVGEEPAEQLPLPAPRESAARGGLRLVPSAPEPDVEDEGEDVPAEGPGRVSLFGGLDDEDEDDDD